MFVVCVSNHKGGVGKTTTALSLATSLARRGRRVVAVDLDPQGNLGMGLGLAADATAPTAFDLLRGKVRASEAAAPVPHAGLELLRVVRAGKQLFQADGWLYRQLGFDEVLLGRLEDLRKTCEFAVLDCSPSLGALTMNGLRAADVVLVPVQCEFFAVQGLESLLEVVELVRRRNPTLALHVLPTLFDQRNRICRDVLARLREAFAASLSEVVVGVDTRVRDAQAQRTPLCVHAPESRANEAYERLAEEVEALAFAPARQARAA